MHRNSGPRVADGVFRSGAEAASIRRLGGLCDAGLPLGDLDLVLGPEVKADEGLLEPPSRSCRSGRMALGKSFCSDCPANEKGIASF